MLLFTSPPSVKAGGVHLIPKLLGDSSQRDLCAHWWPSSPSIHGAVKVVLSQKKADLQGEVN